MQFGWMFLTTAVATGIGIAGCSFPTRPCDLGKDASGIPLCPLSASYLNQRSEAHLAYPGSTVITRTEVDEEVGLDGNSSASVSTTLSARVSPTTLRDWYVSTLKPR